MDFQTPIEVAEYMCSLIPEGTITILEPTPGDGHILQFLSNYTVTAPNNYFTMEKQKFDCIVMNPPFSSKYCHNIPPELNIKGMRMGYWFLTECMKKSDHIISIMPWFTISDSDVRLRHLKKFGLKSLTALPRKTFMYARIQTVVIELHKGWEQETLFYVYEFKTKQLTI